MTHIRASPSKDPSKASSLSGVTSGGSTVGDAANRRAGLVLAAVMGLSGLFVSACGTDATGGSEGPDDGSGTEPGDTTEAPGDDGATESDSGTEESTDPVAECGDAADGTPCDDGNACTTQTSCQNGVCASGESVVCEAESPCAASTCDPETGCVSTPAPEGSECALGCFGSASCVAGECAGDEKTKVECPPSEEPCVDSLECDSATGECTVAIYEPADTACDTDEDVCTLDACDGAGECVSTEVVETCATQQQNNPCWQWQCNKKSGCQQVLFLEGVSCDDGNGCSESDACVVVDGGKLCLGTPLIVDDANPCTDDKCVDGVVTHDPLDGTACELSPDPCKTGQCAAGACMASPVADGVPCGAGKACQAGVCVEVGCSPACGECQACDTTTLSCVAKAEGLACADDGNPCTVDACSGGGCAHTPGPDGVGCGAGMVCKAGACVEATCAPACGICQECVSGVCAPASSGSSCPGDGNPCTKDVCQSGGCAHPPLPTGTPCGGGNTCQSGVCKPPAGPDCLSWSEGTAAPGQIHFTPGAALAGNGVDVHILGGSPHKQHLIYDTGGNSWTTGPAIVGSGANDGAAAAWGGKIFVVDGDLDTKVKVYDESKGSWTLGATRPTLFNRGPAAGHDGAFFYAIGGGNGSLHANNETHRYDPGADKWTVHAPMPTKRGFVAHAQWGGKIYVFGGRDSGPTNGGKDVKDESEAYDPATDSWSTLAPLPSKRNGAMAGAIGGKIYVAGGFTGSKTIKTVEVYDVATNSWATCEPMAYAFNGGAAAVAGGKLYVFGGGSGGKAVQIALPK